MTLNKGFTFAENETITAEKLNAFVDDSTFSSLTPSLLASLEMARQAESGSPGTGQCVVQADGKLDFFYGAEGGASELTQAYPQYVHHGVCATYTAIPGMCMAQENLLDNTFSPAYTLPHAHRIYGVAINSANPGQTVAMITKGPVIVQMVINTVQENIGKGVNFAAFSSATAGTCQPQTLGAGGNELDNFARLLEIAPSTLGFGGGTTTATVFIMVGK